MFFCYDEDKKFTGSFNPTKCNANKMLEKHLENYFFLKFILAKSDRPTEKAQASRELDICNRKIKFWQKQDSYSETLFQKSVNRYKQDYQGAI